jgi:hypothetical protein
MTATTLYAVTNPLTFLFDPYSEQGFVAYLVSAYIAVTALWVCMMIVVKTLVDLTNLQRKQQIEMMVSNRYTSTMSSFDGSGSIRGLEPGAPLMWV